MESIFRFLTTRVSKTISLVTEVFKIQLLPPEPPLPKFISELIPIIEEKPKPWTSAEYLIQCYKLNYEIRSKLVNQLVTFFGKSLPSLSQNKYMSIITLQSTCTLFYAPLDLINPEDLQSFMQCLKLSIQYLPQNLTIFPDFFAVIFERLLNVDTTFNIYNILRPIQIFANSYPEYTSNCLSTHANIFSRLTSSLISQDPTVDIEIISNQLIIITKAFDANKNLDKEICMEMCRTLFLIMEHLKNQKTISKIVFPIISLFVIIKKETNCDIFQLNQLMIFLIKNIQSLFIFTNSETKFSAKEENDQITFKFIEEKTFEKTVKADLKDIEIFESLLKYKSDTNYPLFYSSIILGQRLNNCQFEFVHEILTDLFSNFNINFIYSYLSFLFIFIQQFTQYQEEICQCFTELNLWKFIFGPIVFDPKVPKISNIIKLRQSLFESLGVLAVNENASKIIRKNFCHFLKSILKFPLLFTQVLEMSYPSFHLVYVLNIQDDLCNALINELIIQQHMHIDGDANAPEYRIPTMALFNEILQNDQCLNYVVSSHYFCSGLLYFLFEEPCLLFFSSLINRVIQYFAIHNKTENLDSTALNVSFHKLFLYLIDNIKDERSMNIIYCLLNLFTQVVSFEPSFITPLLTISSSILSDLMIILVNLPKNFKSIRVMEIGLMLLSSLHSCSNFNYEAVPFSAIGESIERLGITKDFILLIYQIIFSGWSKSKLTTSSATSSSINISPTESSTTISVPEAIPLLLISVRNTDHYIDVLNRLIELCKSSVCNCSSCLKVNVPTIVFENTNPNDDKAITLALKLYYEISKYASNRQSLFSFFRIFSSFDRSKLNPLVSPCINTLTQIIENAEAPKYCSLIQFSSENSIIRLPPLSVRDLQSGFVISTKLLLDSERLSRFFFEFKNENQNLSAFFSYGTLNFIANDNQISPTFEMPLRKWFVLSIYFKSFQNCDIYFDDDLIETINLPEINFLDFKKCSMFHKCSTDPETLPLQVQYVTISAKSNAWNLSNLNIPGMSYSQPNELKTFMSNSTQIFEFYADKVVPFDSGKSILTKIPSAHYTGLTIRFFTNFLKVFHACHSISFLLALCAMIEYYDLSICPESSTLLRKISSLFTLLITKTPENVNNILTRNSYSIIGFFTSESLPIHLTKDIWDDFLKQLEIIPLEEQRDLLCQWIIFNYKIIGRLSIDTKLHIFNSWKTIIKKWPSLSKPYLTFQLLLYIFHTLIVSKEKIPNILDIENNASNKTNNKIEDLIPKLTQARQIICSLLISVFDADFKDTDSDLLFYSIVCCSEDQPAIELLDCVKLLLIKYNLSNGFYGNEYVNISMPWNYLTSVISIKSTWASIYINLSQKVCCKFQSIYAETNYVNHEDTNKYCQYLIARRNCDADTVDSSELSLVTNSCRLMLQIEEETSLKSMIEMSSLFLQVPVFFTYAVVSCISSSEEMNDLFVEFFDKLCLNNANVTMLANKLTTYSMFYLIYWAVKRRNKSIFSIAKILSQKAQLAQNAINIIDSFSINCNYDLSSVRSDLLSRIMDVISNRKVDQDIIQMGEVLALGILFRSHSTTNHKMEKAFKESPFYVNEEEEEEDNAKNKSLPELEYLTSLYIVEPDPDNPIMQTYSLYYDSNGKWVEVELTKRVIMFLSTLWTSFDADVHQSLCILISIMIQEVDNIDDLNGLQPIIEKLIEDFTINDEFVNLVIGKIAHKEHVEAVRKLFWPILSKVLMSIDQEIPTNENNSNNASINYNNVNDSTINSGSKPNLLNILSSGKIKKRRNTYDNANVNFDLNLDSSLIQNLFVTGYLALNNYCDQPPASLPSLTRDLVASFVSILEQFPKTPKPLSQEVNHLLNESISNIAESINEKMHSACRHWRQLWTLMTYERSPFFLKQPNLISSVHLKRSSIFHKKFLRPILKRNTNFDRHIEASMKRDSQPADSIIHMPRTNSFSISSFPSHFNFFKDSSTDNIPEIIAIPNRYIWKTRCERIKIAKISEGSFVASSSGFSFLDNENRPQIFIPAENVYLIFRQFYLQRPTAIEIFTTNNKSYFFNFPEVTSHKFFSYFKSILMPNAKFIQYYSAKVELARLDLTRKWTTRQISTFEYLMWINELSGRSMNNLNAYPIFPWILSDYTSESIDLNNEKVYRDLSKPVGALNPTRLAKLKVLMDNIPDINFLYQSTYSSIFMVLHLLVRLEPYTSIHIKYQDGKFDVASRVFTSISDCYQRCCNNQGNFRELIPEFFYCSEFLKNADKFDLGILPEENVKINDVVLPPWAKTAEEFIHIHKMALESDYVSANICKWIDLIWGCKQTGEEAIRSDNTFDPKLYPDCWEKINDPNDVAIVEDMLMKVGIIPQKIFDASHPPRQQRPKTKLELKKRNRSGSLLLSYSYLDDQVSDPNASVIPVDENPPNDSKSEINSSADQNVVSLSSRQNLLNKDNNVFTEIKITNTSIIDTKINGESAEKFKIFSLHSDGRIFIFRASASITPVCKERIGKIAVFAHSKNDSTLFAYSTENSADLFIVRSNGTSAQKMSSFHIDAISCAVFYQDDVITGGKDSIVVKWTFNDKQELNDTQSLMAHAATVSCVSVSDNFGIVVSCSIDGLLVASSASDFSFLLAIEMKIETGFVPTKVMITDCIGNILVLCANPNSTSVSNILYVYNINGKFLKKVQFEKSVSAWCQASRVDGFDFVLIADSSNSVYLIDAFSVNITRKVFQTSAKITHLHYHSNIDMLAIGTDTGSMFIGSLFY